MPLGHRVNNRPSRQVRDTSGLGVMIETGNLYATIRPSGASYILWGCREARRCGCRFFGESK